MLTTNITTYIFCYVMFFGLSWINKNNRSQRLINDDGIFTSRPGNLIGSHIIGILWLGLVPGILLKQSRVTLLTGIEGPGIFFIFLYGLIFTLVIAIALKQSNYVYLKKHASSESVIYLSSAFFIRYFIIRALFLGVYEFWFRGFLLFDSISWVGMPLAVSLNVILYVVVHVFNSKKELLACIPFGILACLLNILFKAVWPAIILHIGFSLVYELNIFRYYFSTTKTTGQ